MERPISVWFALAAGAIHVWTITLEESRRKGLVMSDNKDVGSMVWAM